MRILGYINVYRSGYFHRRGKPGVCDRHGGDVYLSREQALADVNPRTHYVDTVPVTWEEQDPPDANPADSQPISLALTRRMRAL